MTRIPYREFQRHTFVENVSLSTIVNDIEIRGKSVWNKEISSFHNSCLITILETSNSVLSLKRHVVRYHQDYDKTGTENEDYPFMQRPRRSRVHDFCGSHRLQSLRSNLRCSQNHDPWAPLSLYNKQFSFLVVRGLLPHPSVLTRLTKKPPLWVGKISKIGKIIPHLEREHLPFTLTIRFK